MKAEYINPFVQSFKRIFEVQFQQQVEIGKPSLATEPIIASDINIIIGITTDMAGQVIFSMDECTAKGVCRTMMMGMEVIEIDDMARSALQEFSNWVCGHSAEDFLKLDPPHTIDITPPMISVGKVELYGAAGAILRIPMVVQENQVIDLYISLKSKV